MKNTSIFKKLLNNWTSPGLLKAIRWKHSWPGDHSLPCLLCICCFWDDFLCAKCYLWLYCWFCFQPVCHSQVFCGWLKTTHLSVSQVGRIFFKESGEKQTFFFFTIFHKLPVLVFLFQCFPFTVVLQISSHPAAWSHLFNVDLKSGVLPTRCPFSQKICLFSTRTFSARLDF